MSPIFIISLKALQRFALNFIPYRDLGVDGGIEKLF
jgi:hypothetical protein